MIRQSELTPYYDKDGIIIYNGDCRELIKRLVFDVFITDPPYGVSLGKTSGSGAKHGLVRHGYNMLTDDFEEWRHLVPPVMTQLVNSSKRGAAFTGPHLQEQPKADAIGGVYCPSGSGRHKWGFKTFLPVLFYGAAPNLQHGCIHPNTIQSTATSGKSRHPSPKPLSWMRWLVGLVAESSDTILDPFMGSGTTLVAARLEGRRAIGIEIDKEYCKLAVERLRQGTLAFTDEEPVLVQDP